MLVKAINMNSELAKVQSKGTGIHCEEGFCVFHGEQNIFLGSNISLVDTLLNAGDSEGAISIQDYVFTGHGVKLLARGHDYRQFDLGRHSSIVEAPITICKGVWLGSGSIVLGGVIVGDHSVVGAGSVVTKSIPPYSVAVGNPAKVVRYIKAPVGSLKGMTLLGRIKRLIKSIIFSAGNLF
ncbi:MAG: maltose O-acetyltransferase [Psychroserpens sp.]